MSTRANFEFNRVCDRHIKRRLRSFKPGDTAFVLHLTECERCRDLAGVFLTRAAKSPLEALTTLERDFVLSGSRLEFAAYVSQTRPVLNPPGDVPPLELRGFLEALDQNQAALIGHLIACDRCRSAVSTILAPRSPALNNQFTVSASN